MHSDLWDVQLAWHNGIEAPAKRKSKIGWLHTYFPNDSVDIPREPLQDILLHCGHCCQVDGLASKF